MSKTFQAKVVGSDCVCVCVYVLCTYLCCLFIYV